MSRVRSKTQYPENWPEISRQVKDDNDWTCERDTCRHKHDPAGGYCLTVHHLDGDKSNNARWNLACLCQRCHLKMQNVIMDQMLLPFVKVSEWFVPHLEGYLMSKSSEQFYVYRWANNKKRLKLQGRICRIISRGKRNSCQVEFIASRQRECISRNAIKKVS